VPKPAPNNNAAIRNRLRNSDCVSFERCGLLPLHIATLQHWPSEWAEADPSLRKSGVATVGSFEESCKSGIQDHGIAG